MNPWIFITKFGDPFLTLPLAIVILLWLMATRRKPLAICWLIFFSLAAAIVGATKFAYAGWGVHISEFDFTVISGHTMLSSAVYPLAFYLALHSFGSRASKGAAVVGFLFATVIGISRVSIGAHSGSEVIAGWLLGSAVSSVLVSLIERHGQPSRLSIVFAASSIAIALCSYGRVAPIQDWIVNAAPKLARMIGGAR